MVIDGDDVEFRGEPMSLSKAAALALGVSYGVQGPIFWQYGEQTLDERRREVDAEGDAE